MIAIKIIAEILKKWSLRLKFFKKVVVLAEILEKGGRSSSNSYKKVVAMAKHPKTLGSLRVPCLVVFRLVL